MALTVAALVDRVRARAAALAPAAGHARILQQVPLGPGSRLLVVEFAGRRVLIGQSRAGLATLADERSE